MSDYQNQKIWSDFRVGSVTILAVFLLIGGITFAGGEKGLIMNKTSLIRASLTDVGGLKKGSAVTMGGMTIGVVKVIRFSETDHNRIEVQMEVRSDLISKIKEDSIPTVRTQGMLGDRYIDISMGSAEAKDFEITSILQGNESTDFDQTMSHAKAVLSETEKMLSAINEQQGSLGHFFYDETFYQSLTNTTEELKDLIQDFKSHPKKYVKLSIF